MCLKHNKKIISANHHQISKNSRSLDTQIPTMGAIYYNHFINRKHWEQFTILFTLPAQRRRNLQTP